MNIMPSRSTLTSNPTREKNFSQALHQALNQTLERLFRQKDGSTPKRLQESIRYSLLGPGKRIRPRLMEACSEMMGLTQAQILPAAVAIEMIHCFTLIHDDLPCMDDDDFRRGQPTNHIRFGESTALLAGDALLALAFESLLESEFPTAQIQRALKRLTWASGPRGVIGGQAAEAEVLEHPSLEGMRQMHRQKTGALFIASLLIPKDLAGIEDDSPQGQSLYQFADELGLAFQVADDLEDLTEKKASENGDSGQDGKEAVLGKEPQKRKTDKNSKALDGEKAQTGEIQPTSILFYLSPKQARTQTIEALRKASQKLESLWGTRAQPLVEIAEEVILKVQQTEDVTRSP